MRILLADNHIKVLRALRILIAETTEHEIVGEAVDWQTTLMENNQHHPDLILLDWELMDGDEIASLKALQGPDHHPEVIVFSTRVEVKERTLKAGANAFVSKGDSPKKLLQALESCEHKVT